ncbi:FAD-dependent oxidoreductase [Mediterraneibacter glycyrrhizinilyticus]|uniref:FAD-dependent oxidoreductase n=1 Tax=Mediterraneibacter glycyrrhizinilyticus TaxID=342942 RepID=UPI001961F33F|nr:FAD-dependent oxidoreductase [Mediterraneibacter glycyrrhizinilyticus]MBM6802119.1 FAD-dependent oxidoreductase [Mediterraneibacter glycyrrhizinilyticus]MDM8124239.1 FAD-dependent oxidoreductase [Mediterraneibacter glycyrrhizinilyticus]MDM8209549.1 FAD-dependent oxidoreductase [Mediterraneibacter glycyrrhizinilyticus]
MSEERKLILKLGQMITDRIGHKVTVDDPEYWGLAEVLTDEMAEVCLSMKVRKPMTLEEIAKKSGKDKDRVQKLLDEMSVIGMIEYNWENEDRHKQYVLPMFVPGCAEFMMMNKKQTEEHPVIADFFENMSRLPLEKVTPMVPPGGSGIGMHVIPVEKAIPAHQESASVEHISHWLKKYKDKYAVGACSCRRQQRMRGEGCGEIEGDLCIGVGDMADYLVETGKGRYIDLDEVMEILERAERNGFVHQITNIDGEDKIFAICNCAPGVCNGLRTSQLFNTPNMSRSAYRAHVEKEKCVACGKCVEVCPVGAAKLGQKLCTKHGEIKYPKALLPDTEKWGRDKWDPDYRDHAKINCYETGTSPCKTACPAHLAVQGYVKMAAEGRYMDALKLIKQDNPFPAVCGAICNRRCEDACTRGTVDKAVAIDEIKKFIAEKELHEEHRYVPLCENHEGKQFEQKIAVIGAGPAGMSAAYYLRTKGYPVTVFEKEKRPGGMLLNGIPSFRLEKSVIEAEIDVLRQMNVEFRCGVEVGKDITIPELRTEGYKAFYVAVGAQGGRLAGVPGEDAAGVQTGVDFLRKINLAEEVEMLPDDIRLSGRTVVIGGGNVAIDVARTALRAGSESVGMYCLESLAEMPAAADEVAEAREEGIVVWNGWGPKEILADNGKVKGIVLKKCVSVFDGNGRFHPVYDENECITVECENILLSIGQSVEWGELLKDTVVEFNPNGTAKADPVTYQTKEPDIFVGGDVYTGPKFAIDAIAAGKQGCESIHRFVHEGHSLTLGRDLRQFVELDKDDVVIEEFDNAKRQIPGRKAGIAKDSFRDLRSVFTEEQVKAEAARCLGCGATVVDENKCIGCGLCTTKCEFDAIHLSRDLPEMSTMRKAEDKLKGILPYALKRAIKIKMKK